MTATLVAGHASAADDANPRLVGKVFKVTDGDTIKVQLARNGSGAEPIAPGEGLAGESGDAKALPAGSSGLAG